MKFKYPILLLVLSIVLVQCQSSESRSVQEDLKIKTRTVKVEPILSFKELDVNVQHMRPFLNNAFDIDADSNYYLIEAENHRVLKFSPQKELICQIGSIGQADEDLYYPRAVLVDGDSILVLDNGGSQVKRFSLSGQFISIFKMKEGAHTNTIRVHDGKIYGDVRYESHDWAARKPISVFTEKGECLKEIGVILKTTDWNSYQFFNGLLFRIKGNHIYGAVEFHPVIFKYDLDGRTVFYKNLGKMKIPEIDEINGFVKKGAFDTPGEKKTTESNKIVTRKYCRGFEIDENNHFYYSFVTVSNLNLILHFDSDGNLLEKLVLTKDDLPIDILGIYFKKSVKYGIGYYDETNDAILFTF